MKWVVAEIRPDQLFSMELRSDTTGRIVATRQFTVAAKGDSTLVTSSVTTPAADAIRAQKTGNVKQSDAWIAGLSKMMMASLRMQSHLEIEQLKQHIEGKSR
jgi:hypothetical protein